MTDTIAPATAAMSRVKGPVRFQDAAAYNRTLSKEQSDAASRGCHWMSIFVHGYKIPVGVSYNVICCDCVLWTPFFSWFNPLPFCGLMFALPRDVDGGWGNGEDKASMKVVDADHGTIVYYHGRHWISGKVDPNKVLVCWCDK